MASTKLTRSFSTAGNRKTYAISFWVKLCDTSTNATIINVGPYGGDQEYRFNFRTDRRFDFYDYGSGAYKFRYQTNRRFRDINAWYHFVIAVDTTQSTDSNRVKIYVNGTLESNYYIATHPSQNLDTNWNIANNWTIGATESGNYTNGCLSHFHFIDGTAYDASAFGETDTTTGEWKIKTSPSVTYGTNGFFILKDGNSVTDQSGNSNNWTVGGGTLTNTEDNPSNVFDTINANMSLTPGVAGRDSAVSLYLSNGNTRLATDVAYWTPVLGSIPMSSGKYYFEVLRKYEGSPSNHLAWVGIENIKTAGTNLGQPTGSNTDSIGFYSGDGGTNKSNSGTGNNYGSWTANNDIVMCAVDLDNNYIYFGVNGTWGNSCDPTSGSSGTGGISITAGTYVTGFTIHRGGSYSTGGDKSWLSINFGNGYFQTTAVSSAGTNASGNGIFEYDVPTGYTALSTKGLNL